METFSRTALALMTAFSIVVVCAILILAVNFSVWFRKGGDRDMPGPHDKGR